MKKKYVRLLIFGWAAFFSWEIASQNLPKDSIKNVTISSSRIVSDLFTTPRSVDKLSVGERTSYLTYTSLQEQVSQVSGLLTFNSSNYAQDVRLSIRGFGARSAFGIRGVKVIVDGIPETTPDGQGQLDNLILADIENIEIVKGPSSNLYGNAAGGVIQINTLESQTQEKASALLKMGSFGSLMAYGRMNFSTSESKGSFSMSHQNGDGYRDHASFEQTNLSTKWKWNLNSQSTLQFVGSYTNSPLAQDPGGVTLDQANESPHSARDRNVLFDAGESINHWKGGLSYANELNSKIDLSAYGFLSGRNFEGRLPFSNSGSISLSRIYGGQGGQVIFNQVNNDAINKLSVGYDFASQGDDRRRFDNNEGVLGEQRLDQLEKFETLGLYILDHYSVGDLRLQGGLRYDFNWISIEDQFLSDGDDSDSQALSALNPSLGITYVISEKHSLFGNYNTSFETPTLSELSANPTGAGGFNEELKPQRASAIELGTRMSAGDKINVEITAYTISTSDESVPYELEDFIGRTFYRNAGETDRIGIELTSTFKPLPYVDFKGTYSYSKITFGDFVSEGEQLSGNRIPGLPLHNASLSVTYHKGPLYLRWETYHLGQMFADSNNSVEVDAYSLSSFQSGYDISVNNVTLRPTLSINNVFDTFYFDNIRVNAFGKRYYEVAPERFIQFGLYVSLQ